MLYFIAAIYNEQDEIDTLLTHVFDYVDGYRIVDDGSTDSTVAYLEGAFYSPWTDPYPDFQYKTIPHTGLPETVKQMAVDWVPDGAWVLMLDADERLRPETLIEIKKFTSNPTDLDYVYFQQLEIIDGQHVRTFQKCKLFRKEAVSFPLDNIHADDQFTGNGEYKPDWVVFHRKTSDKQRLREKEYLGTYRKLLDDGKIDKGRYEWLIGLHHYERTI